MRIYSQDLDKPFNKLTLYLTDDEAQEVKDSLGLLLNNHKIHHEHIPERDSNFQREITICIYREQNLGEFDERSKDIIKNG